MEAVNSLLAGIKRYENLMAARVGHSGGRIRPGLRARRRSRAFDLRPEHGPAIGNADSLLGPALRSAQPPLSVEDTLATYILFVRSRESGYDGLRSHVAALPTSYSSSIFFAEDELEVCAGTSLYTITKQLERWIEDDYRGLVVRVLGQYPDLFQLEKFTIEDVGVLRM